MVVIRLARGGDKKNPFYRIVAADKRFPRDGRYIEQLGYYDPMARGQATPIQLDFERIDYWQSVGGVMSERVAYLVKRMRKGESLTAGVSRDESKKKQTLQSAKAAKANVEQKAAEEVAVAAAEEKAAAPVEEKAAAPVEEKAAAPVEEKAAAPVEEKAAAPVEEKAAAPVEEKAAAPVEEKAAAPVEEKAAAPAEDAKDAKNDGDDSKK